MAIAVPPSKKPKPKPRPRPVCKFWASGRCNRHPCPFLHGDASTSRAVAPNAQAKKSNVWVNHSVKSPATRTAPISDEALAPNSDKALAPNSDEALAPNSDKALAPNSDEAPAPTWKRRSHDEESRRMSAKRRCHREARLMDKTTLCEDFLAGSCGRGESCRDLHAWSVSDSFGCTARLQGHTNAITGIALPQRSEKLFTGSADGTVRIWDANTGKCMQVIVMEGEVGSLICMGQWVLVGVPNAVKAWQIQSSKELILWGPKGQVYVLAAHEDNNMLFAGTEVGMIYFWRMNKQNESFEQVTVLTGHQKPVISLTSGCLRLFSGSVDGNIRAWDLENFECIYNLEGHTSAVTSLLCWEEYLLSSSLDGMVKVWFTNSDLQLEVAYTHYENHEVLALNGIKDAREQPVLMVSCNDGTVHAYNLPSFTERGQIYSKIGMMTISLGYGGLMFTGDGSGDVNVVRWWPCDESKVVDTGKKV